MAGAKGSVAPDEVIGARGRLSETAFDGDARGLERGRVGSAGTHTGSPTTMPSVEKGRLMVKALHVLSAMNRLVAMANGTTGRPDSLASVAMPFPAPAPDLAARRRSSPRWRPRFSARSAALSASAPPRSPALCRRPRP